MQPWTLPIEARRAVETIRHADLVLGISSFNNERTISHVIEACHQGLTKYFPQMTSVIVVCDTASTDRTREAVFSSRIHRDSLVFLPIPLTSSHRLSFPYHGSPGKGTAYRTAFEVSRQMKARSCTLVDGDLRSITPEWVDLLIRPILFSGYDFVAPNYHREKYEGGITSSIVYPLTRALYGRRIRQLTGGEFAVSPRVIECYLSRDIWEEDVARFGIDIWMTTVAIAEGFRVCQSILGAKIRDSRPAGADLTSMLAQILGTVFTLMGEYAHIWRKQVTSRPVPRFGFKFDLGPGFRIPQVARMIAAFRLGARELEDIWRAGMQPDTFGMIRTVSSGDKGNSAFQIPDELWTKTIYELAAAYRNNPLLRRPLLQSMTPLYLGRMASFVKETETLGALEIEERTEQLCSHFERLKPYLLMLWDGSKNNSASSHPNTPAEASFAATWR